MNIPSTTLTFSSSLVQKFWEVYVTGIFDGQRLGQAFYNHFNLHKVVSERTALDKLYEERDEAIVRRWIACHTIAGN